MDERPPFIRTQNGPVHCTERINRNYYRWSYRQLRTEGQAAGVARLIVLGLILDAGGYGLHWPSSPASYPAT